MMCLLSGGYDSAVAAYHMMKRGAHLSFVHFYGTGAQAGESSLHVANGLARKLVPYQFHAKLYRVPFEAIQREIVRYAPEDYRVLLYRRMMLRIAESLAKRDRSLALVTGDSLGQVASQTLRNLVAVDAASRMRGVSAFNRRGQNGHSRHGEKNRDVRHILRAVSRLLSRVSAEESCAVCFCGRSGGGGSQVGCRRAGGPGSAGRDADPL